MLFNYFLFIDIFILKLFCLDGDGFKKNKFNEISSMIISYVSLFGKVIKLKLIKIFCLLDYSSKLL